MKFKSHEVNTDEVDKSAPITVRVSRKSHKLISDNVQEAKSAVYPNDENNIDTESELESFEQDGTFDEELEVAQPPAK